MVKGMNGKLQELQKRINADLRINDTDLSRELKEQPSKFAYWGTAHALKMQEANVAKSYLQEKESILASQIEEELNNKKKMDKNIRTTDKCIKDAVTRHPERITANQTLIDVSLEENILAVAKEAFRERSQVLLELARDRRNDLTTPEAVYTRKLVKEYEVE